MKNATAVFHFSFHTKSQTYICIHYVCIRDTQYMLALSVQTIATVPQPIVNASLNIDIF